MTAKVPRSAIGTFVDKACANPACVFAANADVAEFGGYCCRKCCWSQEGGFGIPEHGPQCSRRRPWRGPMPSSWKSVDQRETAESAGAAAQRHDEAALDSLLAAASGDTSDYNIHDIHGGDASITMGGSTSSSAAPQHHPSASSTARPVGSAVGSGSSAPQRNVNAGSSKGYSNTQDDAFAREERRQDPAVGDWLTFTELKERYGHDYSRHKTRRYWQLFCPEEKKYDEDGAALTFRDFRAKHQGRGSDTADLPVEELLLRWQELPWVEDDPEALTVLYQAACLDDENEEGEGESLHSGSQTKASAAGTTAPPSSTLAVSATRQEVEIGEQAILAALRPVEGASGYLKQLGKTSAAAATANWLDDWENAAAAAGYL